MPKFFSKNSYSSQMNPRVNEYIEYIISNASCAHYVLIIFFFSFHHNNYTHTTCVFLSKHSLPSPSSFLLCPTNKVKNKIISYSLTSAIFTVVGGRGCIIRYYLRAVFVCLRAVHFLNAITQQYYYIIARGASCYLETRAHTSRKMIY